ncbi:L-idonate 5-dehydrogenase [Bifidobacterium primatium]|uniref:L-idonate 5-dehydrogenase n=2 Tax=Bifidobacterium TaxID=1678 RepID=A0A2M9HBX2_9BIFI|nr:MULTISPECIES: zinc-binding dehydrogenase [Bifidobacterium]NEG96557.1 zinc-binding dehydrogenase [Bifidobacterium sp. SMB2]NEH10526.1 zinc-binding dehydrogenase [Bifidobacterium saimiriisciurei]NEH10691.1 zinc-binding dehydrogenase [Bifidobacterium saimiriisciurei]PJM74290.1 L-idonate 5-dehydrogenase [Bifidobacterium primatium]
MKSVLISGKGLIDLAERPEPEHQDGKVVVRPQFIGICGSDLHYLADGQVGMSVVREPIVPGHEISAVTDEDVEVDGKVIPAGTPVAIHPSTWGEKQPGIEDKPEIWPNGRYLGSAQYLPHEQGGMTEKMAVRPDQLIVLPEGVSLKAAALAEPLGVGLHAINLAGGVRGKKVLVSGAGPIGLLAAGAALTEGAASVAVSDVLDHPLSVAKKLGATKVFNVAQESLPDNEYDLILECSGAAPAISASFKAAAPGATIIQVGMMVNRDASLNISAINGKEITYIGSFRFFQEIRDAVEVLAKNPNLEEVITQVFDVDDYREAFATAADASKSAKVLIAM